MQESPHEKLWTGFPPTLADLDEYKNLKPVLRTRFVTPLPTERSHHIRWPDPLFEKVPEELAKKVVDRAGPYYRVTGDVPSVRASIAKMDQNPCRDYLNSPYYQKSLQMFRKYWGRRFANCRFTSFSELVQHINLNTAAGVPWRLVGIKTKTDFLLSGYIDAVLLFDGTDDRYPAVWSVCPKTEWYHLADILSGKVRTFIIPPVHLFLWSAMLYHDQNELTKDYWWSAYGFNPYQGGVDRLAEKLLDGGSRFVKYDVKGWDRILPLMSEVHDFRISCLKSYVNNARWVKDNTATSHILTPFGLILKKEIGNNSGSGTTTGDNILSHTIIFGDVMLNVHDGDEDKAYRTVAALFGDDNVCAIDSPHSDEDLERIIREVYRGYGLELDPFAISSNLEDMEFLGFQFALVEGFWIPRYPIGRIAASFAFCIEKMPEEALLCKAFTLAMMSAGSGRSVYEDFAQCLRKMLASVDPEKSPVFRAYWDIGVPSFEDVISFYTGREETSIEHVFCWRYGGIKDIYDVNGSCGCPGCSSSQT